MKLSAPIYHLKRSARKLARETSIPLHLALDQVASTEGFKTWSLLALRHANRSAAERLYAKLEPGDFTVVGARPRQGKTLLALDLVTQAVRAGRAGRFFTLEYTPSDIAARLGDIGFRPQDFPHSFGFDCSDSICARYIMDRLADDPAGTVVAIDYLQLLDQKREAPPVSTQLAELERFAKTRGMIFILVAQIDRHFDPRLRPLPGLQDIRLPNPIDLQIFSKACFLHNGDISLHSLA